ncbi:methyltransferase, putative, TIGR00027 family [Mycolicibacterium chubuense NBB4]|uniref:S-adenosyl-L-methionine-dependent methyltransferase n=1 Tax=Mycolicibacterium chubuense (strain NBB4) TaxID=710421 RepID=I4BDH6_MYCCN|nr:SAM-dependent methyltransferase [Mycolicibacterium chubuense]AFM15333.1 methyltransferase, putative, TIGR00027 family [Mycolicibacterium chubuense NBB4]
MTRRDGDTWDITEGVGRTALGVATARAWETASERPLFTDPYAQLFLDATGDQGLELSPERRRSITDYAAARTKWFDDFFLSASAAGVSQVVILAAGLDTRAWRLPWLSDSVIYEVDQPKVLSFKTSVLDTSDAQLSAKYMPVPVDLRDDWPHALRAAGFDHNEPTAWSAEGLLPYLSAAAQDRLFEQIGLYSARGSRIAVEAFSPAFFEPENVARYRERSGAPHELWYMEERTDVAAWLCAHRWDVTSIDAVDLMSRYHRAPASDDDPPALSMFVEGRLL